MASPAVTACDLAKEMASFIDMKFHSWGRCELEVTIMVFSNTMARQVHVIVVAVPRMRDQIARLLFGQAPLRG
jgi:hypothetical protein